MFTTVSYMVSHKGHMLGPITSHGRIRQSDSILPYIFIICGEALSCLFSSFEDRKKFHGYKVVSEASSISHLFVDDALYFSKANIRIAHMIRHYLKLYKTASGK